LTEKQIQDGGGSLKHQYKGAGGRAEEWAVRGEKDFITRKKGGRGTIFGDIFDPGGWTPTNREGRNFVEKPAQGT